MVEDMFCRGVFGILLNIYDVTFWENSLQIFTINSFWKSFMIDVLKGHTSVQSNFLKRWQQVWLEKWL